MNAPKKWRLILGVSVALFIAWLFVLRSLGDFAVGVDVPIPASFIRAHPALATYTILVGLPLLFLALLGTAFYLLWPRRESATPGR
jgi:hypothetical protein